MNKANRTSRAIAIPMFILSAVMVADSMICASFAEAAIGVIGLFAALALSQPERHLSQTLLPSAG